MAFDSSVLFGILSEIEENILGRRVRSVRACKDGFFIELSGRIGIAVNLSRSFFSLFISERIPHFPDRPDPAFILLLRKHLLKAELVYVAQHEFDRIVFLEFELVYPSRLRERKKLVLELIPSAPNAFLVGEELEVLACWRERKKERSFYVSQGLRRINPLVYGGEVSNLSVETASSLFQGMSSNLLKYLSSGDFFEKWAFWMSALKGRDFSPVLFEDERGFPKDYWILDYDDINAVVKKRFSSVSELVESFLKKSWEIEERIAWESKREKEREDRLKYLIKKREKLLSVINRAERADLLRRLGEIILANLSTIKKGCSEAELLDPYTGEHRKVKLDPSISPVMNAEKLFKESYKLKRGAEKAREELRRLEEELFRLKTHISDSEEKKGSEPKLVKEVRERAFPFRKFEYNGWKILVGKGAESNDLLTFKRASPHDIWLHVQGSPGSHVIIENPSREEVPRDVLEYAASLAAYYSKAKMSTKVPVDYTLVKYVKRHPSGRKGAVLIRNQRTIWARPKSGEIS